MSKKCVIEIWPTTQRVVSLGVDLDGRVMTHTVYADDLEELTADYINEYFSDMQDEAYQRGLEDGKQTAIGAAELREKLEYQKGFNDGKAQAERGCEGCEYEGRMSPCSSCARKNVNDYWTAKQTDDEIKVGDEVIYNGTRKCFVVRPESDDRYAVLIDSNGNHHHANHSECEKTGRHFDIASILKEMQS